LLGEEEKIEAGTELVVSTLSPALVAQEGAIAPTAE